MNEPARRQRRYHQPRPPVPQQVQLAVDRALAAVAPVRPDKALPLLQEIQAQLGHLPAPALAYASRQSRIPLAELNALVSYYDLLTTDPDGGVVIHLCDDLVCRHAPGARELAERLSASGQKVRFAPCLGRCDHAPSALVTASGGVKALAYGGYASWQYETARQVAAEGHLQRWPDGYQPKLLARCGRYSPGDLDGYARAGGLTALTRARAMSPAELVHLVKSSRLVGRGGAAFPTGLKWESVLSAPTPYGPGPDGARKYVVVNADESETGTFTNRVLLEEDPMGVLESALIAARAMEAERIYIYIRGEYPRAILRMTEAIQAFQRASLMDGRTAEVRVGGGRYVCGEETALFASIEGERGAPRVKPPYPVTHGLFHRPTLINNVETLINAIPLVNEGADAWNRAEPKLFSIAGCVARPGVYELPAGITLAQLIDLAGGPVEPIQAVLMGGASGHFLGPDRLATPLTFQAMADAGTALGSGAVMLFGDSVDLWDVARRAARFFAEESCGKCTPCRIGTARQVELVDALAAGESEYAALHAEIAAAMRDASICGLGQTAANCVGSLLKLKGVR